MDPRGGKNRLLEASGTLFGARSAPGARQGRSETASGLLSGRCLDLPGGTMRLSQPRNPIGPMGSAD